MRPVKIYQQSRGSQGNDLAQDLITKHCYCCSLWQSIKETEQGLEDEGDEIKVLSPGPAMLHI